MPKVYSPFGVSCRLSNNGCAMAGSATAANARPMSLLMQSITVLPLCRSARRNLRHERVERSQQRLVGRIFRGELTPVRRHHLLGAQPPDAAVQPAALGIARHDPALL